MKGSAPRSRRSWRISIRCAVPIPATAMGATMVIATVMIMVIRITIITMVTLMGIIIRIQTLTLSAIPGTIDSRRARAAHLSFP
ncbi:hypothetical protein CHELA41_24118 [Hyphomicrobiales bacterium]|nr:hypothetical protein CHELA41_24118 [Hyphomicrobiales bacterium]